MRFINTAWLPSPFLQTQQPRRKLLDIEVWTSSSMSPMREIRRPMPDEAKCLSELAMRSKAHWGYSPDFLDACRPELTVKPVQLLSDRFEYRVALQDGAIVGFIGVDLNSRPEFELEALFVEPDQISSGVGRLLLEQAIQIVADFGGDKLLIQGDPNATHFYFAVGARQIGTRESGSIPGRQLPLFQIDIRPSAASTA